MHEIGLAAKIIQIVKDEIEKRDIKILKLKSVKIKLGKFVQVVPDSLKFGLEALGRGDGFGGVDFIINEMPFIVKCPDCEREEEIEEMVLKCAGCGSVNLKVVGGREFYVESIEVDD